VKSLKKLSKIKTNNQFHPTATVASAPFASGELRR
jgi:hypothetical protein